MTARMSCEGCKHYLGGGCCQINLEAECGAGSFEAFEPVERGGMEPESMKPVREDKQRKPKRKSALSKTLAASCVIAITNAVTLGIWAYTATHFGKWWIMLFGALTVMSLKIKRD